MPDFGRIGAIAVERAIAIQLAPNRANAQAALIIPEAAVIIILGKIS